MRCKILIAALILVALAASAAATMQQAEDAIASAERDIIDMQQADANTESVNITLAIAKYLIKTVSLNKTAAISECDNYDAGEDKRYCEIQIGYLRTLPQRTNISKASIDEEYYSMVLQFTVKIKERKKQALEVHDAIKAVEFKIQDYGLLWVDTSNASEILDRSKKAMQEERFDDAIALAHEAEHALEASRERLTVINVLLKETRKYIAENKVMIIVILAVLAIIASIVQYPLRAWMLRKKVEIFNAELVSLDALMKQAQNERFMTGEINDPVYDIRMQVYKKRLDEVKRELPIAQVKLEEMDARLGMIFKKT